jgi:K+-transporting ATPase ATPase C chain
MRKDLITGLLAVIVLTLFLGVAYPLVVTGVSQVLFPGKADGSQVKVDGKVVGSSLIGQSFSRPVIGKNGKPVLDEEGEEVLAPDPAYFQPRPSATGYSGNATFFGNVGPNSVEGREEVRENLAAYVALEKPFDTGLAKDQVPVDAVTQSGSGVDPHISEANARIQAHRIAAVRKLPLAQVEDLISANTDGRFLGLLGEPGVNVLQLNIALDKEAPAK